eukprot:NODE_6_length_70510_cov_1.054395.p4 type:complete len:911 gc:universal NODE_6_length_70510_cov_1.054395:28951-31683(+)
MKLLGISALGSAQDEVFSYLERILAEWIPEDLMEIPNQVTKRLCEIIVSKWIVFLESEMKILTFGLNIKECINYFTEKCSKIEIYAQFIQKELMKEELHQICDSFVYNQIQDMLKKLIQFDSDCRSKVDCFQSLKKFDGVLTEQRHLPEVCATFYKMKLEHNVKSEDMDLFLNAVVWSICSTYTKSKNEIEDYNLIECFEMVGALQNYIYIFDKFDQHPGFHSAINKNLSGLKEGNLALQYAQDLLFCVHSKSEFAFGNLKGKIDSFNALLLEESLETLTKSFNLTFSSINENSDSIFKQDQSLWKEHFLAFRREVSLEEDNLMGVVNQALESTESIERKLSLIRLFSSFPTSEKTHRFLDQQKRILRDIIMTKIQNLRKQFDFKKAEPEIPIGRHRYCGSANWAFRYLEQLKYFEGLMKQLIISINAELQEIEAFKQQIRNYVSDMYNMWKQSLADDMDLYLQYPIFSLHSGTLNVNLDIHFINSVQEASAWKKLNFEVPNKFNSYISNYDEIIHCKEIVSEVCVKFNLIRTQIGMNFDCVFQHLKEDVLKVCQKGLYDLNWSNLLEIQSYCKNLNFSLSSLYQICFKTRTLMTQYLSSFEKLSQVDMLSSLSGTPEGVPIEDALVFLNEEVDILIQKFKDKITELEDMKIQFQMTLRFFNDSIWLNLKSELLAIINELIVKSHSNLVNNLSKLLSVNNDDQDFDDAIHFLLLVKLDGNKLQIVPSKEFILDEIHQFLKQILKKYVSITSMNVSQFTGPEMRHDIDILYAQCEKVLEYDQFKDIYEVNKDAFIRRYSRQNPTLDIIDADIQKYVELAAQLNSKIENYQEVNIFTLNNTEAKNSILWHCSQWQEKFKELLGVLTGKLIDAFVENKDLEDEIESHIVVLEKYNFDIKALLAKFKNISKIKK